MTPFRRPTRWLITCTVLAGTLLLAGCSSDDDSSKTSPSNTAATSGSQGTPPVAGVPEGITLGGQPASSVAAGSTYSFEPQVSLSSTTVTFSVSGLPTWAHFDPVTGQLAGSPSARNEGTTGHITISASNATATATLTPFTIRVTAPESTSGQTATLSWSAPTENTDGSPVTGLAGYRIYYGMNPTELTETITVVGAESTSYVIEGLAVGTYYFSVTAFNSTDMYSGQSNQTEQAI